MESFIYLLINISKDNPCLPWIKLPIIEGDNYFNILQEKLNVKSEDICAGLPKSFSKIFDYIRNLHHNEQIDYDYIESLLHLAAKEWKISLPEDQLQHRFHWLLEGKRGTEGTHFQRYTKHLESFDSFMERNKNNDSINNDTFKTHVKESKEEQKTPFTPNAICNAQKIAVKKGKKVSKKKKLGINQFKNFSSQNNSISARNPLKMVSPPSNHCQKFLEREYKMKMDKMLDVVEREYSESYKSNDSCKIETPFNQDKLIVHEVKQDRSSFNNKVKRLLKCATNSNTPARNEDPAEERILLFSSNKRLPNLCGEETFNDFPENSTLEVEGNMKTHKPLLFCAKAMNLKLIKGNQQ